MTREQQRKLRELKTALPKVLKEKIKKYKFNKRDYMIWFYRDDIFLTCFIYIGITSDKKCVCTTSESLKPFWIDDLLWDFLKMPGNKNEPLSLRAIGAFTVSGVELYNDFNELKNWEISELEIFVDQFLEHFYQTVQTANLDKFYENISYSPYHEELRVSLSLVYECKYQEALDYLHGKGRGIFCNENIWLNDSIGEFCRISLKNVGKNTGC